jgi:hypothetical protein
MRLMRKSMLRLLAKKEPAMKRRRLMKDLRKWLGQGKKESAG